mmetsp:Transcript_163217/g.523536  ORF Transcript_163217/g.523536 Transcript_163217/m.523536 type:complete len:140 (+) Transcript_163217:1261-1680(+)
MQTSGSWTPFKSFANAGAWGNRNSEEQLGSLTPELELQATPNGSSAGAAPGSASEASNVSWLSSMSRSASSVVVRTVFVIVKVVLVVEVLVTVPEIVDEDVVEVVAEDVEVLVVVRLVVVEVTGMQEYWARYSYEQPST